jgi:glutathione S-transferase
MGEKNQAYTRAIIAYLDSVLADNEFLAGDSFSVADITVFADLGFTDFAKIDIPESLTNLQAWHAKVAVCPFIAE